MAQRARIYVTKHEHERIRSNINIPPRQWTETFEENVEVLYSTPRRLVFKLSEPKMLHTDFGPSVPCSFYEVRKEEDRWKLYVFPIHTQMGERPVLGDDAQSVIECSSSSIVTDVVF